MELWSVEQARQHLGAATKKSASRTLSRWGVKAVAYERGESGRPEARFDAEQVRAAAANRAGRGARTDLARTIPSEPGQVDYAVLAQVPPVRGQAASSVWDQLDVGDRS